MSPVIHLRDPNITNHSNNGTYCKTWAGTSPSETKSFQFHTGPRGRAWCTSETAGSEADVRLERGRGPDPRVHPVNPDPATKYQFMTLVKKDPKLHRIAYSTGVGVTWSRGESRQKTSR